jgi:DNA polymerase III subunit beta
VMQFADERSRAVRLRAVDGEILLHSSLTETGESEESLTVTYTGPKVDIGFNAQYLLEFLRAGDEAEVSFFFKDAGAAGELRPAGDTPLHYRYVVMPMRI